MIVRHTKKLSQKLEQFLAITFCQFPWEIRIFDWTGNNYSVGKGAQHWYPQPLTFHLHTEQAANDLLGLNSLKFLERILSGEVDLEGNLYLLSSLKLYANIRLNIFQFINARWHNRHFQTSNRAHYNVKSHYDISQSVLEKYLDKVYMAYSCAMFENTELSEKHLPQLIRVGTGQQDDFDSLEKAQWKKFKDAIDFIDPKAGDSLLDVGCGYGGQLQVALQEKLFSKVVGWTHSHNQASKGRYPLEQFEGGSWELNEGDYRQDQRQYNHITSTGMISHVGPGGLERYVKNIRYRLKKGGRYVHHALMANYSKTPLDAQIGIAFNKKYVWPGFHWFTLSEHMSILEKNGFRIEKVVNLRKQYCKTLTAWYERMMVNQVQMKAEMGEATFRAWQIYLGGGAGPDSGDVNRIYCTIR